MTDDIKCACCSKKKHSKNFLTTSLLKELRETQTVNLTTGPAGTLLLNQMNALDV